MVFAIRFSLLGLLLVTFCPASATEPSPAATSAARTRIGAVAYAPSAVTIFDGLTRYLNQREFPCDYVLYSNYDALVAALEQGDVDIAWNTPLAHGQYHVRQGCASQTLVMRDVDLEMHSLLVVRADANIESLADLNGKRLVLGSEQAAEATVLPLHFLKAKGVDGDKLTIVRLDREVDGEGNPCASPWHVLEAVRDGRGDAGIITDAVWNEVRDKPDVVNPLRLVWTSPAFSHCVFTAAADFDAKRAARFTELMTAMDPEDEATRDVMRLEGTKRWLPGSAHGFTALIDALKDDAK